MNMRQGGHAMRLARLAAGYKTLDAVLAAGYKQWGEKSKINKAQISRIENARAHEPPMEVLYKLAYLYHVSPAQFAEWFELPWVGGTAPSDDSRIVYAKSVADALPPAERERLYDEILLAAQHAEFRYSLSATKQAAS